MPPTRGRASLACTACHKQKTRCYPSGNPGGACLRCETLQQSCSLLEMTIAPHSAVEQVVDDRVDLTVRLSTLERTMTAVLERLERLEQLDKMDSVETTTASSPIHPRTATQLTHRESVNSSTAQLLEFDGDTPLTTTSAAPVFVIRDIVREVGAGEDQNVTGDPIPESSLDIVDKGFLGEADASSLLKIFFEHYGRWVAFSETTSSDDLLLEVRRSPLLLCACCLIAVRHTTQEYASALAPGLFHEAKSLLSAALLIVPQPIAFFQVALILSLWSTTIGQALLSIDSWLLSGFALQHCLSSSLFGHVTNAANVTSLNQQEIERWFIWNHICLVHLHYCVGTRRKAMLSSEQISICGKVLDSRYVNNFESRMVAEINLYWILYESCSSTAVDLPKTQSILHTWRQQWEFLFDQPRPQFVQMGFHFAQLLVYEQALNSRSAAVRESLISEMLRLSATILDLVMDTADLRTPHLSDHIYHTITFAAVTMCRLLHMYEEQLARYHDIAHLDQLILTLVTWLHSIGLPCHVAHTLGDVVSAFHTKLRPNAQPTPIYEEAWAQVDLLNFPDQFGSELFYFGNGHFSPDWDPFIQGPTT